MPELYGVSQPFKISNRVAVVGSGGSLIKKSLGKKIDESDFVIRFNGATVLNQEEDVGSKTDLLVAGLDLAYFSNYPYIGASSNVLKSESANRFQNALIASALYPDASILTWCYEEDRAKSLMQYKNSYFFEKAGNKRVITWVPQGHSEEYQGTKKINLELEKLGLSCRLIDGRGARTGLRIILQLLKSGIKPTIFGFQLEVGDTYKHHYYDNQPVNPNEPSHDIIGEINLLKEMTDLGLVILGEE